MAIRKWRKLALLILAWPVFWALKRGEQRRVVQGMIAGAVLGLIIALLRPPFIVFGILFGAYLGAVVAAAIFRKVPSAPTGAEPLGDVWKSWEFRRPEISRLVVLLEHAVYIAYEDPRQTAPWPTVLESLAAGKNPNFEHGVLIMLSELADIERRRPDDVELDVRYRRDDALGSATAEFATIEERDQFVRGIEHALGHKLRQERRPIELGRAIIAPLILLIPLALITVALAGCAVYMGNLPEAEQFRIVKLRLMGASFITNGPLFYLKFGSIPCVAALAWLLLRAAKPPQREVLIPSAIPLK